MRITGKTDTGKVRAKNEDAVDFGCLSDGTAWALVCDGMGGVHGGQVASTSAISVIKNKIMKCYKPEMEINSLENMFLSSITTANVLIYDRGELEENLKGMGTTIVSAFVKNNEVCIAHVGDSRAYKINGDEIEQLTTDHSLVQQMYENGQISKEQLENHPNKNIITRAMGVDEDIDIDFDYTTLDEGEALILCTDGLSGMVKKEDILNIYKTTDFELLADRYIECANENGGRDNISVVIMKG